MAGWTRRRHLPIASASVRITLVDAIAPSMKNKDGPP
jgi:hypothetical protein